MEENEEYSPPSAPGSLGKSGRALWDSVVVDYELNGAGLRLLFDAATEADIIDELHDSWTAEGMPKTTFGSRNQLVAHPTIGEIRQHKSTLRGLIAALKLAPIEDEPEESMSVMTIHDFSRLGNNARWGRVRGGI